LWPETVEALRAVLAERRDPVNKADADLVFITGRGFRWVRNLEHTDKDGKRRYVCVNAVARVFNDLVRSLKIHRRGVGFYALRHTFQTIGDEVGDYLATRRIMGHADNSISDVYRERFADERLQAVADYVRGWLFGKTQNGG
jgi:integrase